MVPFVLFFSPSFEMDANWFFVRKVIDPATDLQRSVLEPLLTVHPYNHIVNSVVIARVTGGADRV